LPDIGFRQASEGFFRSLPEHLWPRAGAGM
jgi:hypothetical protein